MRFVSGSFGLHRGPGDLWFAPAGIALAAPRASSVVVGGRLAITQWTHVRSGFAGSGFTFDDRGEHKLKGVPGSWQLYAVKP